MWNLQGITLNAAWSDAFKLVIGGHGGRVVILLPPTSEIGIRFPARPQVGNAGSCLPLVGSLQYRTLTNCLYWFPLPFQRAVLWLYLFMI